MTAEYQSGTAGGRSGYEDFWNGVETVSLSDVEGSAPNTVTATVTFRFTDGTHEVDHTRFRLVREGGILKIAESTVG
jgi:hypothetical protein